VDRSVGEGRDERGEVTMDKQTTKGVLKDQ